MQTHNPSCANNAAQKEKEIRWLLVDGIVSVSLNTPTETARKKKSILS